MQCARDKAIAYDRANVEKRKTYADRKEYFEAHYQQNKAKILAKGAAWRAANSEKQKANIARWRTANRPHVAVVSANWLARNRDKANAVTAKRHAAKLSATPAWADAEAIKGFYRTAQGLSMLLGEWYEVDHIVPLRGKTVCGLHVEHNLRVVTRFENQSKNNRHWPNMGSEHHG